ncbi:MAG: ribonuclease E/G [Pseudomonadota bacterium]
MKGRQIILDMDREASRAALMVDGVLQDLLIDGPGPDVGAISWAKVDRVVPGLSGAFVTLSKENQGFLREAKGVKAGQGILIQVTGFAEPGKATPVTRRVLYKGRRLIHTPDAPGINISRQIRDPDERARLTEALEDWMPDPASCEPPAAGHYTQMHQTGGVIVRTAAQGTRAEDLRREYGWLLAERAEREASRGDLGPVLAIDYALREWTAEPVDLITYGPRAEDYVYGPLNLERLSCPEIEERLRLSDTKDPFEALGIWEQIQSLNTPLSSGGSMVVEATRALVAVDVNTQGNFSQGAAMTTNIEACRELPRQLRLRGLGGQIVVDFAPLKKAHRKKIEEVLKAAFRKCPVETTLAGWTPLGNLELQRKRERRPLDPRKI